MNEINLSQQIQQSLQQSSYMEQAAQDFASLLYERFKSTIVLSRVFATIPYGKLPKENKSFVDKLAEGAKIKAAIRNETAILSLMGSRGENIAWNNRRNSRGHIGIPLASSEFVGSIPMLSRLLREIGFDLSWIDNRDTDSVHKTIERRNGLFYVRDAKTEMDRKGRKIISAQDFVDKYQVKTVFAVGGGYILGNTFVMTIVFTRKLRDKAQVEKFLPLFNLFKMGVQGLISKHKYFVE
jgi:hypothetical protein